MSVDTTMRITKEYSLIIQGNMDTLIIQRNMDTPIRIIECYCADI